MSRFEFRYLFDGKLCDVVTIDFNKEHVYILADDKCAIRVKLKAENLFQSIGKRDKNGTLIYEGDIVHKKYNKDHRGNKMYSTVVFCQQYAEYQLSDENGLHRIPANSDSLEIVGNICKNPEIKKGVQ